MGYGCARVSGPAIRWSDRLPQGRGVWRDDRRSGRLVFDEPVIINCYTTEAALEAGADEQRAFLVDMGTQTAQGAVGLVIDRDYLEIKL